MAASVAADELERVAGGLHDSLQDHGGFMAKLADVESAMQLQLSSANFAALQPLPRPVPTPTFTEIQAVTQRKRRRRKFARAALGAIDKPSLATLAMLAPLTVDDDSSAERTPRGDGGMPLELDGTPGTPYSPSRHQSPFITTPSSGGRGLSFSRAAIETRTALEIAAANNRGNLLWAAALRVAATESASGSRFDLYCMLAAVWSGGSSDRSALIARLQEALDVPHPYGVRMQDVTAVEAIQVALEGAAQAQATDDLPRVTKLGLFALATPAEIDDGYAVGGAPPGRGRADVDGWMALESAKDTGVVATARRVAREAAAAVRPPDAELTRSHGLVAAPWTLARKRRHAPGRELSFVEHVLVTAPPWPATEEFRSNQEKLEAKRVSNAPPPAILNACRGLAMAIVILRPSLGREGYIIYKYLPHISASYLPRVEQHSITRRGASCQFLTALLCMLYCWSIVQRRLITDLTDLRTITQLDKLTTGQRTALIKQ